MKNNLLLARLVHPERKPRPILASRVTPRTFADPDEFERWIADQNATPAFMLEIPEKRELPFAAHPRGYVALTSHRNSLFVLSVGTDVKALSFKEPLPAGQPVVMWVNPSPALAA